MPAPLFNVADFDQGALAYGIGGIGNHHLARGKAGDDFDFGAQILADADLAEVDTMIGRDDGHAGALPPQDQGVAGDEHGGFRAPCRKAHLRIHAGHEHAARVRYFEHSQHGARIGVECIRDARDTRGEDLARQFLHAQFGGLAGMHGGHIGLRHVDEDAQDLDLRDVEELRAVPALPELMRVPISTLRAVITPSKGAVMRAKAFISSRRCRLASLACTVSWVVAMRGLGFGDLRFGTAKSASF